MKSAQEWVRAKLFEMQDSEYRVFQAKLMPTVLPQKIIGIRTPELRKFAKEFKKTEMAENFLKSLPHEYYDENNLHAFLVSQEKDYEKCIRNLNAFLPHVDNWATCDMMRPISFKKNLPSLLKEIERWLESDEPYTVRFGIEMLMVHFLDEHFEVEYLQRVAAIKSDEYYVEMMIAWYFATALAKQYDATLPIIEAEILEKWVHNKTIQKAVESYRLSNEQKQYLKKLKITKK